MGRLGNRYTRDEDVGWGRAIDPEPATTNMHSHQPAGTLRRGRRKFE